MESVIHGGDIYSHPVKMDFSVNVNPLGPPPSVVEALHASVEQCSHYPDLYARELRGKIAETMQLPEGCVLCGNGASELFMAMVHAIKPKTVGIPVPSFYGYQWAARAAGAELQFFYLKEEEDFGVQESILEFLTDKLDLLFLASPGNPAGNVIPTPLLEKICQKALEQKIYVVLDECFLDFTEEPGFWERHRMEDFPNLVVVRAFTKTYAIPGVRLGYLLSGNGELLTALRQQLPEWNLSIFAQRAGCAALEEQGYLERTRKLVQKERSYMQEQLRQLGMRIYPGEANFLLFQTEPSIHTALYTGLLERGILIRDCSNYEGLGPGFYRVAVKDHASNRTLLQEMRRE